MAKFSSYAPLAYDEIKRDEGGRFASGSGMAHAYAAKHGIDKDVIQEKKGSANVSHLGNTAHLHNSLNDAGFAKKESINYGNVTGHGYSHPEGHSALLHEQHGKNDNYNKAVITFLDEKYRTKPAAPAAKPKSTAPKGTSKLTRSLLR